MKSLFSKRDSSVNLELKTDYANQYAAYGPNTLIDGVRGGQTSEQEAGKDISEKILMLLSASMNQENYLQ